MKMIEKDIVLSVSSKNAKTFFEEKMINISVPDANDYSFKNPGLGYYRFIINPELISKASNEYIKKALEDINEKPKASYVKIDGNGFPYIETNKFDQYLMYLSPFLAKKMEIILWATFADWKNNIGIEPEILTIRTTCEIKIENGKEKVVDAIAELIDVEWKIPRDNVFCDMAIQSAYYYGASSIAAADEYFMGKDKLDFYMIEEPSLCTGWKNVLELNNEEEQLNVIYMLYDENRGHIYVGRADKLKVRLLQHRDKVNYPNDPIPEFTHYRYTKLQDRFYKYSYLIEDAAIHDMAWIFSMPESTHFHRSLQEEIKSENIQMPESGIKMVNRVECQPQIIKTDIFS